MTGVDFSKYRDIPTFGVHLFGEKLLDLSQHPKWDIPNKIAITAAPTGAFFTKQQNPYQPYDADEIIKESIESVEAGACCVHVHVRDENGFPSGDRKLAEKVVRALRDRFGENIYIDGEALFGENFEQMMEPIKLDLYEGAAVNCFAAFIGDTLSYLSPQACKATAEVIRAYDKKVVIAIYNLGDIDNANRWLIQPGILKPPFLWGVCIGLPGASPAWSPLSMTETLINVIRRIKDIDKEEYPFISFSAAGRASSYLTALSILLGYHVRVGKEDTIYKLPQSDEVITSTKERVEQIVAIARMLGREPMTATEFRKMIGVKPPNCKHG